MVSGRSSRRNRRKTLDDKVIYVVENKIPWWVRGTHEENLDEVYCEQDDSSYRWVAYPYRQVGRAFTDASNILNQRQLVVESKPSGRLRWWISKIYRKGSRTLVWLSVRTTNLRRRYRWNLKGLANVMKTITVEITDAAIEAKLFNYRSAICPCKLPDKAIDLMDETAAKPVQTVVVNTSPLQTEVEVAELAEERRSNSWSKIRRSSSLM